MLVEIINTKSENDYITFEITSVAPIALQKRYAGIGATIVAKIKNTKTTFSIDLGFGDIIVPEDEKREIPTQLDGFKKPVVSTYSIETTIAEKLDAILDLMEFSSRMKDYYDIYYLANIFDFDGATLARALRTTFENRGHNFTVDQFNRVITFADDINMQKKWKLFIRKIDVKTDEYSAVIDIIKSFLAKPFATAVENIEFTKKWSASQGLWL